MCGHTPTFAIIPSKHAVVVVPSHRSRFRNSWRHKIGQARIHQTQRNTVACAAKSSQSGSHRTFTANEADDICLTPLRDVDIIPLETGLIPRTVCFAMDAEIYRRYLYREAKEYLTSVTQLPDSCTVLVAVIDAEEAAQAAATCTDHYRLLDPNKRLDLSARACLPVIGVSMVSYDTHARETSLTCNPPSNQPFLSNMGVTPAFRGKGIASELLMSCEELARNKCSPCKMYLLARQRDSPAISLYRKHGYTVEQKDWPWLRWIGMEPMLLMAKSLD